MNEPGFEQAQMQRGMLLMEQSRFADAAQFFREALAQNPLNALAFNRLAVCELQVPGQQKQALETIQHALECEPNEPLHHAVKSFVLGALDRDREALVAAREAIALDPNFSIALHAEAQALIALARWAEVDQTARRALALDADDSTAANQLAVALRLQNKMAENAGQIAGMLARDPEDAHTHTNAGWAALQRGERQAAEQHFLEALRLDPEINAAREGLMDSFRARSPVYRAYLKYCFFMQRFTGGRQFLIIFGALLLFRFAGSAAMGVSAPLGIAVFVFYYAFVLWVWIARGVGNFILLFDRFAKHALRRTEKWEAYFVGGGAALGAAGLALGYFLDVPSVMFASAGILSATIPLSLTFTNQSPVGRWLFGGLGSLGWLALLLFAVHWIAPGILSSDPGLAFAGLALIGALATTWLGNVPFLRRR
jgi:tetratricopeptide (TPR) repeat protein